MKYSLFVLILCISGVLKAQEIKGYITDEASGKPLPYVNVYFANTTIGSSSDSDGFFVIRNFKPGKYDLTVSYVGYQTYSLPVELPADTVIDVTIKLREDLVSLPEVFVMADTSNWESNFTIFKNNFLGTTPGSEQCLIKNKKTLLFYYDKTARILYAHAREPIVIENKWLGYIVTYDLYEFELDFNSSKLMYYGIPRFTEMKSDKKRVSKRWEKRRMEAYNGSNLHFMRALYEKRLSDQGFETYELQRIKNPERPTDIEIDSIMKELRKRLYDKTGSKTIRLDQISDEPKTLEDSLIYYSRLKNKPPYREEIAAYFPTGDRLVKNDSIIFSGILQVTYADLVNEQYPWRADKNIREKQKTKFYINKPLRAYENGYYDSVKDTYVEGYWSWTGSLANLLPLNYYPD